MSIDICRHQPITIEMGEGTSTTIDRGPGIDSYRLVTAGDGRYRSWEKGGAPPRDSSMMVPRYLPVRPGFSRRRVRSSEMTINFGIQVQASPRRKKKAQAKAWAPNDVFWGRTWSRKFRRRRTPASG